MRILCLAFILSLAFVFLAQARDDTAPPPMELRSLAEELAPYIKNTPDLPERSSHAFAKKKKTKHEVALTPVEESFSKRAGQPLRLFGYRQIGKHLNRTPPTTGEVQDDMIVGAGDSLIVTFRGQRDDSKTYRITPQGQLIVNGMEPIQAAGLSFGSLRAAIESNVTKQWLNTNVFVSMKTLRQITVTVMGEVNNPGSFTLSPFQTVLDAMAMAKGMTTNGSLRNVRLVRAGKTTPLDFYHLLLQGDVGASVHLRDGDKIIVPVLGQTVAVSGDVKRPAIFERASTKGDFTLDEMLRLSGGVVKPGANRFVRLALTPYGEEKVDDLSSDQKSIIFHDGDMLVVTGGDPLRTNGISLLGHVRQTGPRSLDKAPTLRSLLESGLFLEGVYPLMGIVERLDTRSLAQVLIPFSPARVIQGKDDLKLQSRDRVMLFSTDDIRRVMTDKKKEPKDAGEFWIAQQKQKAKERADNIAEPKNTRDGTVEDDKDNPLLTENIIRFLRDHAATVTGAVMEEGLYPIVGKVALSDVLNVSGGIRSGAEDAHVEIILANPGRDGARYTVDLKKDRPDDILIAAKDKIAVSNAYTVADATGVEIFGEVARPGIYDLRKGDTLLDLIERAGGITDTGYAPGTIFMREAERRKQIEQFRRIARELDLAITGYYMKEDQAEKHSEQIKTAQKIADDLRRSDAVGRITVEADPQVLKAKPHMAVLLQPGDRVFVPRKPSNVAVTGEVLSPSSLQFVENQSGSTYIRQAGGMTRFADDGRAFVVFPDGSASPLSGSVTWHGTRGIPVGSTIVVPRDPDPLEFLEVATSIGQIVSQLAITTVAIADINSGRYARY